MNGIDQIISKIVERYFDRWSNKTSSFQRKQLDMHLFWSPRWRSWSMLSQLYPLLILFIPPLPIGYLFNIIKDSLERREVNDVLLYGSNAIGYIIGGLLSIAMVPVVMHLLWMSFFKKEINEYLTKRNINVKVPISIVGMYVRNFFLMLAVFMLVVVFMRKEKLDTNGIVLRNYFSLAERTFKYSDVVEVIHYSDVQSTGVSAKKDNSFYKVVFTDGQYYQPEVDRPNDELQAIVETLKVYTGLPIIEKPYQSK